MHSYICNIAAIKPYNNIEVVSVMQYVSPVASLVNSLVIKGLRLKEAEKDSHDDTYTKWHKCKYFTF